VIDLLSQPRSPHERSDMRGSHDARTHRSRMSLRSSGLRLLPSLLETMLAMPP